MNFSAVILAGGKSSRMGQDKAFLEMDGRPLLARQIELVRAGGAAEVFISGRDGVDYSAFGCRVLKDQLPYVGPLAGIERALSVAAYPLLLVLAVDLPAMPPDLLLRLAARCTETCGVIPQVNGRAEPLAAFYPGAAHALAKLLLDSRQFEARRFANSCVKSGLACPTEIPAVDAPCFFNWNSPAEAAGAAQQATN